jgi:hypothetical protein
VVLLFSNLCTILVGIPFSSFSVHVQTDIIYLTLLSLL